MIIKYFSWIKEHVGKSEEQIQLPRHINNVDELINYLNERDKKMKKKSGMEQKLRLERKRKNHLLLFW